MAPVLSTMRDAAPVEFARIISRRALAATAPGMTLAIGLGVGIGAVIFIGCVAIVIRIMYKRKGHHKALLELEQGVVSATAINTQQSLQQMAEASRPVSATRCIHWGPDDFHAITSDEEIARPEPTAAQPHKRQRTSLGLPKHVKPWTRKHLSTITESPRIASLRQSAGNWSFEAEQALEKCSPPRPAVIDEAIIESPIGSPKFSNAMPRPAIHPASKYGTAILNINRPAKPQLTIVTRSVSMGVLSHPTSDEAVFDCAVQMPRRPEMHARSISLGAPLTRPPSGPVPPLPVTSPTTISGDECIGARAVSRISSSSSKCSVRSSVLLTSPILERHNTDQPVVSPTVEDLVDSDSNAELRNVANKQQNPRISGPRPDSTMRVSKTRNSVRAKLVRSSTEGSMMNHLRNASSSTTSSTESRSNRLSVPEICSAERVALSRVSSSHSFTGSFSGVQKISTPTKRSNRISSVSVNGSPAQKRRASALREVSGNPAKPGDTPTRQPSSSTLLSRSSSNGNPFQWDTATIIVARASPNSKPKHARKPSALKGSPNARKPGHRRQQCVRINKDAPQVFPARSQSSSPSPVEAMNAIGEQRESDEMARAQSESLVTPTEERQSYFVLSKGGRAPSANALSVDSLRVQTLRASLTPSSPTLSTWNDYSETERTSLGSRQVSEETVNTISASRPESTASERSFIIPKFPVPANKARASISPIQCDTAPMPEFNAVSPVEDMRTSQDNTSEEEPSPITPADSDMDIPSSPPLRSSKTRGSVPSWPRIDIKLPGDEYDPASPPSTVFGADPERSSLFLPFAMDNMQQLSPRSRPSSYVAPAPTSPACSPKTIIITSSPPMPEVPARNRSRSTLTSANASSSLVNFPGSNVPVLLPPKHHAEPEAEAEEEQDYSTITLSSSSDNEEEEGEGMETPRAATFAVARAPTLSTIIQSSSPPASPAPTPCTMEKRSTSALIGPRAEPGKSVIKNISALRRMNSDASRSRESRTYMRLGREASPLLPWIPKENSADELVVDVQPSPSDVGEVAAAYGDTNAMDEIDFEAMERNIDGALAGFDAEYRFSRYSTIQRPSSAAASLYTPPRARGKENVSPSTSTKRDSSVWDDGEKFWQEDKRPATAPSAVAGVVQEKRVSWAMDAMFDDPKMLLTPVSKKLATRVQAGTPGSLYDADGFLKA